MPSFSPDSHELSLSSGRNPGSAMHIFCIVQQAKSAIRELRHFSWTSEKNKQCYLYKANPYSASEFISCRRTGIIIFVHNTDLTLMIPDLDDERKERLSWLQTRVFQLYSCWRNIYQPSSSKSVADGKTSIRIVSDPIPTASGVTRPMNSFLGNNYHGHNRGRYSRIQK